MSSEAPFHTETLSVSQEEDVLVEASTKIRFFFLLVFHANLVQVSLFFLASIGCNMISNLQGLQYVRQTNILFDLSRLEP